MKLERLDGTVNYLKTCTLYLTAHAHIHKQASMEIVGFM